MWSRIVVIIAITLLAAPAWAGTPEQIRQRIIAGDYQQARAEAEALGTAEGYVLAAESLSAQIFLGEIDKLNKHSKEARKLAEKAMALDPDNYDAHLQYALAYGFYARTSGTLKAWRKKLPAKSLTAIYDLQEKYPDDPRVQALLGAWHLGIIRKIGEGNAGKWFGANLSDGEKYYGLARNQMPDDIIIASNYYMSVLAIDYAGRAASEKDNIERLLSLSPSNDVDTKIQQRLRAVLDVYDDEDRVEKLADAFLDGDAEKYN